jgi:hypothetical protein
LSRSFIGGDIDIINGAEISSISEEQLVPFSENLEVLVLT